MFRFYQTILNLKTRLKEQNLIKILMYFHYHLNLFVCYKTKLKIKYVLQNAFVLQNNFFAEWIFFNRIKFFQGDANIYFKQITFFEKKKKKILLKSCKFSSSKYNLFLLSFATFEQPYMFLWCLRNFQEHLFWTTSANSCSWIF